MREEVLTGATAIGRVYGWDRRQVYNLIENQGLPAFKIGRLVAARKSAVDAWLAGVEQRTAMNKHSVAA